MALWAAKGGEGPEADARAGPTLLRYCISTLATLRDVLACRASCQRWWRLSLEAKWVKCCVLNGSVTASERPRLWRHLAGLRDLEARWCARLSEEEAAAGPLDGGWGFEVLAARELPRGKVPEIERDVHRTFPTHPLFKGEGGAAGRAELLKVLRAIAAAEPDVGYCQGMNFVAATLLIHVGTARDAFWMLLALIESYHFQHVFAPGVPLLPLRIFQFSGVVREHLPRLWRHLKEESFSLDIFAHQCVLTLFAYSIEPDFLAHVYDVFFMVGWKAVFRIGLGLLASMEGRLLGMSVEEISRFMHQCKRHYDPGEVNGGRGPHGALCELLKFKVSRATLESLQHAFQLERWEVLLRRAGDGPGEEEPLPVGLKRSPSASSFLVDANAFCTSNAPPLRASRGAGSCSGQSRPDAGGGATPTGTLRIPIEALRELKAVVGDFDAETQRDVATLRDRIADTDRELAVMLRDSEGLRCEVEQSELERLEWQEYKKALMEALQVAVKTSPAARRSSGAPGSGGHMDAAPPRPQAQDDLVMQCLGKLNRLESDIFDRNQRWQAKVRELEPIGRQIDELRDVKARSMAELNGLLESRSRERRRCLGAGLREVLPPDCIAPDPAEPEG
mmetsp:Transcript_17403/g.52526  ORF Transcript_17403/g.52526 Transcript_17403/m.52526 type:complete len:619 (+) Transcript_17403:32-1888(+)